MKMHNMSFSHFPFNHMGGSKKIATYEVALKDKKEIADGTFEFVFEKPENFHFRAGQHVRITLIHPQETDRKGNSRFLTLANTPQDKDLIVAMRMTDSAFKRVFGQMQIGDKVQMQLRLDKVHESFTLHKDASRPAVFLIGGIGIVPAYSMIKDATERKLSHKIFLFYSNRRSEDAPFLYELQHLAKQNSNFKLIATLTQPEKSEKEWQGETGVINQPMIKKYIDHLESPIYYIAGLSGMVNSMNKLLEDMGINKENIREENFSDFKMHIMTMSPNTLKSHFAILAIALVAILVIIAHTSVAVSMFKSGANTSFLKNPIFYIMVTLMLVIIPLKLKNILSILSKKS